MAIITIAFIIIIIIFITLVLLLYFFFSGMDPETRIDIHTQTQRKARSANTAIYGGGTTSGQGGGPGGHHAQDVGGGQDVSGDELQGHENDDHDGGLYRNDLDMDWKTQSLPSLGRVSSEQTLESSGDEFAALRRNAPTRMLKSNNMVSMFFREINFTKFFVKLISRKKPLYF